MNAEDGMRSGPWTVLLALLACAAGAAAAGMAESPAPLPEQRSLSEVSFTLPGTAELVRVLTLRDYNTRVVVLGVSVLGLAAGLIGSFLLLRKRALLGDALSHATLPGIGVAFLLSSALGGSGKSLSVLLLGAAVSGVLGFATVLVIVHLSRIKSDAALGIVLSVFFGAGVAVLGIIQNTNTGNAAGLNSFIYGKTASMLLSDALTIGGMAVLIALACLLLFKELALLCFDPGYAGAQGWPVVALDIVLMGLVVAVTVIGLQAVGLILMIALLVIPPAAARFWTERLRTLLLVSAGLGAASGFLGAALSALVPRLPAGAIIVVVASAFFGLSLVFGRRRGILRRLLEQQRLRRIVARQNLLRTLHELGEPAGTRPAWSVAQLARQRAWTPGTLRRTLAAARRAGLVEPAGGGYRLTDAGAQAARRVTRNHRLWELFLLAHADTAPHQVDREADQVEHVLSPEMIAELETLLAREYPELANPPSPHRLPAAPVGGS